MDIIKQDPQLKAELNKSNEKYAKSIGRYQFRSQCGQFIYHVSIIDYLQKWNARKFNEHFIKVHFLNQPKNEISVQSPQIYQKRFYNFLLDNLCKSS